MARHDLTMKFYHTRPGTENRRKLEALERGFRKLSIHLKRTESETIKK